MKKTHKNHGGGKKSARGLVNFTTMPRSGSRSEVRRISYVQNQSLTAATYAVATLSPATMRSNGIEWSSYAARYQEYRVLQIKVHPSNALGTVQTDMIFATDRSGAMTAPSTVGAMWATQSPKLVNLEYTTTSFPSYSARGTDLEDQDYVPISTNQVSFQIFAALTAPSASTTTVALFVEFLVEFKGTM